MKRLTAVIAGLLLATTAAASEPEATPGLMGLSFHTYEPTGVERIMEQQVQAPVRKGELSEALYIKTQERLANSFDQPIPERIAEPSSD